MQFSVILLQHLLTSFLAILTVSSITSQKQPYHHPTLTNKRDHEHYSAIVLYLSTAKLIITSKTSMQVPSRQPAQTWLLRYYRTIKLYIFIPRTSTQDLPRYTQRRPHTVCSMPAAAVTPRLPSAWKEASIFLKRSEVGFETAVRVLVFVLIQALLWNVRCVL